MVDDFEIPPVPDRQRSYDWTKTGWHQTENGLKAICHPDAQNEVYVDGEFERELDTESDIPIDVYVHSYKYEELNELLDRIERIFHP